MFPKRDLHPIEKPIVYELNPDGSNKDDFCCAAGTLDEKSFVFNYAGWPRSDLAVINEQTDIRVAQAMLNQILDLPQQTPSGLNDTELILSGRSKYCQSMSEQIAYTERMIQMRDERFAVLKAKAEAKEANQEIIDFKDSE